MPRSLSLRLESIEESPLPNGVQEVRLVTDRGTIDCRYHDAPPGEAAVLWVFGAGGGLGGPAGGLYVRLAERLTADRVASLRLDYRRPGDLKACVLDIVSGMAYLEKRERTRVALVGHSFGGAVVIAAAAAEPAVAGVAALSAQIFGTEAVADLSPRPLLLIHGASDEVLPEYCSHDIYRRALEPKRLIIYPGCRHGLDQCRDRLDLELLGWLRDLLVKA
ncbi:MAG TPA: alpha/beta hydrolase [Bryobacteraceae bacterium]|nr:alpha/beta hydrolase [Bryobacteraceae bacterium]